MNRNPAASLVLVPIKSLPPLTTKPSPFSQGWKHDLLLLIIQTFLLCSSSMYK